MSNTNSYSVCVTASCVVGAVFGWLCLPEPRAIDGALVLAGTVTYPLDSVQGIYFHNMWTAIHQILAFFLWLGADQMILMALFNAALGASFFAGLALVMFALTQSVALSLSGSLLIVLRTFYAHGPDYPILFISSHSFGQIASSLSVLCVGLLGNRRYRAAGFVAGALPAFHPVVGSWAIAVALAGSILVPSGFKADTARLLKGLAIGLGVSAISFGFYWMQRTSLDISFDDSAFNTYMETWEAHRQIAYWPRTAAVSFAMLVLLWLLLDAGRRLDRPAIVQMSAVLLVSTAGSWALYELVHHFHSAMPSLVSGAMLGRLVNLHFLLVFPVMAGLLYLRRETAPLLLVIAAALVIIRSNTLLILTLLICLAAELVIRYRSGKSGHAALAPYASRKAYAACFVAIGLAGGAVGALSALATPIPLCSNQFTDYCRSPDVSRTIRQLEIVGLTAAPADLAMMVHRHGHKPVILGASGFDFVPYLPQTAAQVESIIESLYGLDFKNPPAEYRNKGNLLPGMGKEYWSKLSAQEWDALAKRFCLGAVVAPSDWPIRLVPDLDSDGVKVYIFPGQKAKECRIT